MGIFFDANEDEYLFERGGFEDYYPFRVPKFFIELFFILVAVYVTYINNPHRQHEHHSNTQHHQPQPDRMDHAEMAR